MIKKECVAVSALVVTVLAGNANAADSARGLEEVMVTSSRIDRPLSTIPNTVTVISSAELEQQLAIHNDISTVLGNLIPSFSPSRQKMTNAGESLRGRKPLYMIDGVPQSSPLREGGRDGHIIDSAVLSRVEVLHGANAIHGLGASGGIINLITRRPSEKFEQSVRVDSTFQTEDVGESADYGVTYSISNRFGNADVLASLSYREAGIAYDANGDVIGSDNTQGDTMDSRTINAFIKTGYEWDDQRVEVMFNRYDIEGNNDWISIPGNVATGTPSSAVRGFIEGEGARNKVTNLALTYTNEVFLGQNLRAQIFSQDLEATYGAEATPLDTFQDPAYGPNLIDQSQNNSEKQGVKLTLSKRDIAGLPVTVVYGFDVLIDETWQELIQTGRSWVPKSRYENYASFLQLDYTGIDRLTLTGGLRYEDAKLEVDDFTTLASAGSRFVRGGEPSFSETLYNIGATYRLTDAWRVFANRAEAFSMPDVGRVLRGINIPNQSVESFLDLQPVLTENTEVGLEFKNAVLDAQVAYFRSSSDLGQRLQRGSDGIYSVQREKTQIDGVEFRTAWHATDADTFGIRYAHTDGRYDSNADGRVDADLGGANVAPDRVNVSWDRAWSPAVSSRLQVNHLLDRDFENSAGVTTVEFDGYTTVDVSADIAAFGGTVSAAVQNLTNEDYFTYHSQTNAIDVRYFKGIGRTFRLQYQVGF
ncbi:TonB-dependent receptor [Steroidobacter sp. S1-65]|uniref:TonB-dependent receptor n=1 Tax=Steroidobacter gossypii TaxID=2805490 RepID=A0ABS1WWS4_9GAMM|nr:TonB-dependent receptor [Steroidobacter gossypii]MBM0105430.1 TonB-dependent receptor [Steroidobacter gossypii]